VATASRPRTSTGPARFYADVLGLEPADERPGGLLYRPARGGEFALFLSAGRASGEHTQMGFEVADIEATVAALRARGVEFETVDAPGLTTLDGIADIDGNYASTGAPRRARRLVPRQRGQPARGRARPVR
jgi:catechol 2,3-dioxygenase-like lactoylglutathione lyase family enzyme